MINESLLQVPATVEDPDVLKRFLDRLVERLDIVLGYRGDNPYAATSDLDTAVSALTAEAEQLAEQLGAETESLNQQLLILVEQLEEQLKQLVDLLARVETLETEVSDILLELVSIDSRLDALETGFASVDSRVDALEAEVSDILLELVSLDSRLDALETGLASVEGRLDVLEASSISIDSRVDALEAEVTLLDSRLDDLEADVAMLLSYVTTTLRDFNSASWQTAPMYTTFTALGSAIINPPVSSTVDDIDLDNTYGIVTDIVETSVGLKPTSTYTCYIEVRAAYVQKVIIVGTGFAISKSRAGSTWAKLIANAWV